MLYILLILWVLCVLLSYLERKMANCLFWKVFAELHNRIEKKLCIFSFNKLLSERHICYLVQCIKLLLNKNVLSFVLPPEVGRNNLELCKCSPKDLFQVSGTELPARTWPRSRTPEGSRRDPIPDSGCSRNR